LKTTYDGKSVNEHFIRKREMIPDMDAAEKYELSEMHHDFNNRNFYNDLRRKFVLKL